MRWRVYASVKTEHTPLFAAIAGSLFKMADFTRSVAWRFWFALLILCDMLVHLVRAATLEDRSEYQTCLATPSTCTRLCDSLLSP